MYSYGSYLAHYGVRGMKWGRRRYQNKDGSLTPAGRARYSDDSNEAYNLKKKGVNKLTNAELRKLNERTRLENEYKRLNPNAVKKGLAIAGTLAGAIGTMNAIYGAKNSAWFKAGKALVKSRFG